MIDRKENANSAIVSSGRRTVLKAGAAGALALGFPAIVRAQSDKIKIGHLTPLTGFLGALGGWAVQGIRMAQEEINAAGGVMGRQLDVMSEDSVNPATASNKAQRMLERDSVAVLMGEINSASALTITQVAARNKKLFMSIGARSDALRGKDCNRYTFHVDIPVTVMVNAAGKALAREGLVKGKRVYCITSDYLFGHDLAKAAKKFFAPRRQRDRRRTGCHRRDRLQPLPAQSPPGQARPDRHQPRRQPGDQLRQAVSEFGLPYAVAGFNLNTADAWAAGAGNLGGIWPTVWHHDIETPGSKAFVAAFTKKYGKMPENHAWIEYVSLKMLAQAMNEAKSTDTQKLIAYFETGQVRPAQGAQGLFPRLGPPDDAGGLHLHGQARRQVQERDFLKFGEAIPAPDPAGTAGADQSGELLRFSGLVAGRAPLTARARARLIEHAIRVPARTGGQRPRARGLLPAAGARPVADLQRRRHRQSGARRVLRARRLPVAGDHEASGLRRRSGLRRWRWRCWACCSSASCCAASTGPTRS